MATALSEDLALALQGREWARSGRGARIRRVAGVTQAQLAREIGVDPMTVSRWERGERVPRDAQAIRYARVLALLAEV
jgi:transcriptional regulator with XRE-family HTH domain